MGAIIDVWQTDRLRAGPVRIYPDGCRDVIWVQMPGQRPYWKLAGLDTGLRFLHGAEGASLRGYRLAPGSLVADDLMAELNPEAPEAAETAIAGLSRTCPEMAGFLAACRDLPGGGLARLARHLGASPRSVQRMVLARTGQSPLFWRRLMRLRAGLAAARDGAPLAEAAADAGFADQAHFTREARAFHGAPPGRLLADPLAMSLILAPGL